jgi:hypothetical protein
MLLLNDYFIQNRSLLLNDRFVKSFVLNDHLHKEDGLNDRFEQSRRRFQQSRRLVSKNSLIRNTKLA